MTRLRLRRRLRHLPILLAGAAAVLAPTAALAKAPARPMKGTCATTFTVTPEFQILITGSCALAHLGAARYDAVQTVVPNGDGTVAITVDGFYTASNGDRLHSTISGTGTSSGGPSISYTTTETFDGGTGRFADATGVVSDSGVATFTSPSSGTSRFTMSGTIQY